MKKNKALAALFLCYLIWGVQPLYWALADGFDAMFVLACRIVMSAFCVWLFLACTGRFREAVSVFRNPSVMKYLIPASLFLCCDWGFFTWGVMNGRVLDTALGYYMNPIVIFAAGMLLFRERGHALEYIAVGLACTGVAISTVRYGSFPLLSALCAVAWPTYATIKKAAKVDPVVSIAVEATLLSPFAAAYVLLFCRGAGGFPSVTWGLAPILAFSGVITALPMVLYTYVVNDLPFKVVGILQYAGTTISFLCGVLLMDETVTPSKLVMFLFIWAGLIVFTVGNFRRHHAEQKALQKAESAP